MKCDRNFTKIVHVYTCGVCVVCVQLRNGWQIQQKVCVPTFFPGSVCAGLPVSLGPVLVPPHRELGAALPFSWSLACSTDTVSLMSCNIIHIIDIVLSLQQRYNVVMIDILSNELPNGLIPHGQGVK